MRCIMHKIYEYLREKDHWPFSLIKFCVAQQNNFFFSFRTKIDYFTDSLVSSLKKLLFLILHLYVSQLLYSGNLIDKPILGGLYYVEQWEIVKNLKYTHKNKKIHSQFTFESIFVNISQQSNFNFSNTFTDSAIHFDLIQYENNYKYYNFAISK